MSDEKDIKPSKKTSAVPLRKETVRVTLKSTTNAPGAAPAAPNAAARKETVRVSLKSTPPSAEGASAAPSVPGVPTPSAAAPAVPNAAARKETVRVSLKSTPGAPAAPKSPVAPPPTGRLSAPSAPKSESVIVSAPSPAPTIPAQTGAGTNPAVPAPAPTVKLNTPTSAASTAGLATGPATVPLAGSGSQPLPKATVQLQETQPMGEAPEAAQSTYIQTADDDSSAGVSEGVLAGLSVAALLIVLVVFGIQIATANIWVNDESRSEEPGWGRLFQ